MGATDEPFLNVKTASHAFRGSESAALDHGLRGYGVHPRSLLVCASDKMHGTLFSQRLQHDVPECLLHMYPRKFKLTRSGIENSSQINSL